MAAVELYSTSLFSDANLQAYWRLEGNSNDATANGHNGTDTGMSYNSSYGKFGQGANFVNTYPNNNSSFTATVGDYATFTIVCWIKTSYSGANDSGIVTAGAWNGTGGLQYRMSGDGKIHVEGYGDNPATETVTTGTVNSGTWRHIAVTYKTSATPTIQIYIDGTSDVSQTYTSLPTINFSSLNTYVGTWLVGTNYRGMVSGYLDDIAIFNRILSSSEISTLYNGPTSHNLNLLGIGT